MLTVVRHKSGTVEINVHFIPNTSFAIKKRIYVPETHTVNLFGFIKFRIIFSIESTLILKLMCPIRNMNFHSALWTSSGRPAQWRPPSPPPTPSQLFQ